jgi:hypothetical protein
VSAIVITLEYEEIANKEDLVSVLSLFKNPMILMAIFSLGLIVGMPYLLENSTYRFPTNTTELVANTQTQQWTPKPRKNLKRCKRTTPSQPIPLPPFKTSILPAGWLVHPVPPKLWKSQSKSRNLEPEGRVRGR